jgi:hypothetical protein
MKPAARRYGSALRDMGLTSFRLFLPDRIARELPQVATAGHRPPKPQLEEFIDSIRAGEKPHLYFAHALLPHTPYEFLPSGEQYPLGIDGNAGFHSFNLWGDDEWQVTQQQQRELLQVAYVDRLVGQLVDRMKQVGIYDRAALVLVADHGVSFRPGEEARIGTPRNLEGIMPVPFFVKAPGQQEGEIRDEPVQTIDVLPTLAGTLGVRLPWETDGVDALSTPVRRAKLTVINADGERLTIATRELLDRRRAVLRRQVRLFGEGSVEKIFAAGPHRELLGTRAPAAPAEPAVVRFDQGAGELASHDPDSGLVPARVVGHLTERPGNVPIPLAIALNGRIRATTWTYEARGHTAFSAMLPPAAMRPGRNDIGVFAIEPGGALRPLGP